MEKRSWYISNASDHDDSDSGWIAMIFLVAVAIVAAFILLAL